MLKTIWLKDKNVVAGHAIFAVYLAGKMASIIYIGRSLTNDALEPNFAYISKY